MGISVQQVGWWQSQENYTNQKTSYLQPVVFPISGRLNIELSIQRGHSYTQPIGL